MYDSADYDHLHRARAKASFRPMSFLENLGELLQDSITLVIVAARLIPYGLWLPLRLAPLISTLGLLRHGVALLTPAPLLAASHA